MSVQTYNELITMPLGEIFKNITNKIVIIYLTNLKQ